MGQFLFQGDDVFLIRGWGVIVVGDVIEWPADSWLRVGEPIEVVRADGSRLRTEVREMERFTPSTHGPFAVLLGPEVERDDVEAGVEVWRLDLPGI